MTKHVESLLIPRLDEGSNPSISTIKPDNQDITQTTPNFTPNSVEIGCFYISLTPLRATESNHCLVSFIVSTHFPEQSTPGRTQPHTRKSEMGVATPTSIPTFSFAQPYIGLGLVGHI